jgi:hypothetical protein
MKMKKRKISFLLLIVFFLPLEVSSVGRKYEPEEGTFDRRKRIEIRPLCRLVKETIVPDDVICEYQSQKRGEKNKEIYLGAPGNTCQKQITCPKK